MGFCQSAESKTAAAHGDNGNHAQMNFLEFSAPSLVQERLVQVRPSTSAIPR